MKLHQLLAIETSRSSQTTKLRQDLIKTFGDKRHLFEKKVVTFTPAGEGSAAVTEQQSDLQTTVRQELSWIGPHIAEHLDLEFQINETNTRAAADIELPDGTILAKDVPATTLLELQKRLNDIQELAKAIPTFDPAKGFTEDKDAGAGIRVARPVTKKRTTKVQEPLVLYPATEKHPAQVQMITSDKVTGEILEQEWSGMMTPADKSKILDRIEVLSRAVRSARAKANEAEVDKTKTIGGDIVAYIFG